MTEIHPTAIVSSSAEIGKDVRIGPYAILEDRARIGDGSEVFAQAQVRADSVVGERCQIGSGAMIGADPQFIGFDRSTKSGVRMGNDNVIREYVTLHRSIEENGETVIGDGNYLMNGAHVGHDSVVGSDNVMANNVLLGGHVEMGDRCFLGGGAVFHQFVRIGDFVMAQGLSGTSHDVPPYTMLAGTDNEIAGLNVVGLRRGGFEANERNEIKEVFKTVYRSQLNLKQALEELGNREWGEAARRLIDFLSSDSKKGFCLKLYNK